MCLVLGAAELVVVLGAAELMVVHGIAELVVVFGAACSRVSGWGYLGSSPDPGCEFPAFISPTNTGERSMCSL